jgi:hypothetical protein
VEHDAPACETCGKTTCPDADLPEFSEPRACVYAPIYRALRDSKDCDYGCARDYTNQAVRLWIVEAVEQIAARAWDEGYARGVRDQEFDIEGADNPYRAAQLAPSREGES